jgi:hypothetical protein
MTKTICPASKVADKQRRDSLFATLWERPGRSLGTSNEGSLPMSSTTEDDWSAGAAKLSSGDENSEPGWACSYPR